MAAVRGRDVGVSGHLRSLRTVAAVRRTRAGRAAAGTAALAALCGLAALGSAGGGRVSASTPGTWGPIPPGSTSASALGHEFSPAVALPDGRLMVLGGWSNGQPTNDVEVFDPSTGQWSAGPPVPGSDSPVGGAATLLSNGDVLLTGGTKGTGTGGPFGAGALSTQVLVLHASSWSSPGHMDQGRAFHVTVALGGGRALMAGGKCTSGTSDTEIYDPAAGVQQGPCMRTARPSFGQAAVPLSGGRVLVAGGDTGTGGPLAAKPSTTAEAEIFTGSGWTAAGSMSQPRTRASLTLSRGTSLVVALGGADTGGGALSSSDVFDGKAWHAGASLQSPRLDHAAASLPDGRILVAGGVTDQQNDHGNPAGESGAGQGSAEVFDPGSRSSVGTASMATPRQGLALLPFQDRLVAVGGFTGAGGSNPQFAQSAEAYTSTVFATPGTPPPPGTGPRAAPSGSAAPGTRTFRLSQSVIHPGEPTHVRGGGFAPGTQVTLALQSTLLSNAAPIQTCGSGTLLHPKLVADGTFDQEVLIQPNQGISTYAIHVCATQPVGSGTATVSVPVGSIPLLVESRPASPPLFAVERP